MTEPRLSIVVPIFNEERTVESLIDRLQETFGSFAEILFVDDGSTDGSPGILDRRARSSDIVIHKTNGGKGSAVRAGFARARGVYVAIQDADLEYDPRDLLTMLERAEREHLPVICGSRRLKRQSQYAHIKFYIGGCVLTWICNVLFGTRLTDQPNCYKILRRDILRSLPLTENDFRLDAELTALLGQRGIPIVEQPTSYSPRTVADGKKICLWDWFKAVWVFLKIRFSSSSAVGHRK